MSFHYALHSRPISCSFVLWPATFPQPDRLKHRLELAHRQFKEKNINFLLLELKKSHLRQSATVGVSHSTRLLAYMNHICRPGPCVQTHEMTLGWPRSTAKLSRAAPIKIETSSVRWTAFGWIDLIMKHFAHAVGFHSPCHWLVLSFLPPLQWQETEDFGRKKEIRTHMYRLREARLKDFYVNDMDSKAPNHVNAMADHSFESLKSNEIRGVDGPMRWDNDRLS